MRYRLRTLLIVGHCWALPSLLSRFQQHGNRVTMHPDIQFPWLASYALFAFFAGVIGLVFFIEAVLYLEVAAFVTGESLHVDGGPAARSGELKRSCFRY